MAGGSIHRQDILPWQQDLLYNQGMFKCMHAETSEDIIILHPRWRTYIDRLRALDQADLLLCPGCRQPVRVKAGEHRRNHFAHKHLAACSLGSETPEILAVRAAFYEWLLPQFGEGVTLEYDLPDASLPRPVDLWITTGRGTFAYWIIEHGLKLEPRAALKSAFANSSAAVTYLFLETMLHEEKKRLDSLLLSPTERTFLMATAFDHTESGVPGRSLHYFNPASQLLTTFRDLQLYHRPNWFSGRKRSAQLQHIHASIIEGGFVHPGEMGDYRARRAAEQKREIKRQQYQQRAEEWSSHLAQHPVKTVPIRPTAEGNTIPALRCDTCGKISQEYSYSYTLDSGERVCRCRDCLS